jgi:hypothetical protein
VGVSLRATSCARLGTITPKSAKKEDNCRESRIVVPATNLVVLSTKDASF